MSAIYPLNLGAGFLYLFLDYIYYIGQQVHETEENDSLCFVGVLETGECFPFHL